MDLTGADDIFLQVSRPFSSTISLMLVGFCESHSSFSSLFCDFNMSLMLLLVTSVLFASIVCLTALACQELRV